MKKILMLVIVLAIIWAVPGLRHRIGFAALPLLERLGPVGERMATPMHNMKARNQVSFYLRIMRDEQTEGRQLPDARSFTQWTARRFPSEPATDPWGNAFWLSRDGRRYTIGSNGADGQRGTADDVTESATF
jgi:hypothetical protein